MTEAERTLFDKFKGLPYTRTLFQTIVDTKNLEIDFADEPIAVFVQSGLLDESATRLRQLNAVEAFKLMADRVGTATAAQREALEKECEKLAVCVLAVLEMSSGRRVLQ